MIKQVKHLSRFERRLNTALWTAFAAALVYAFVEQVVLAEVPEVFSGGAALGKLFYDLSIAYTGAFAFYLLVVVLPMRRDRRNTYRHLAPLIGRVVGEAVGLMNSLNEAAGVESNRKNTWTNVENACTAIGPRSSARFQLVTPTGNVQGTVLDVIRFHTNRAHDVNREILSFAAFLDSDVINLIAEIEKNLGFIDTMRELFEIGRTSNTDMSVFAREIFDYLQLADHLDDYRTEFLPITYSVPPELIAGTERVSDAIPLTREMND